MHNFAQFPPDKLIRADGFDCACGRQHKVDMKYLKIGSGALACVPEAVRAVHAEHPMIVCGPNGYKAAGAEVCRLLDEAGIRWSLHIIPCQKEERIAPAEFAVGSIALNFDHKCDLILAVGSGVINDLCKVISTVAKRPYIIVGTAPSMDGYTSDTSAMDVNNIKLTLREQAPIGVICDTKIMAAAPMRLLWAGLGDMMAKFTALCEWHIASLVLGEYYCSQVAELVRNSLQKVLAGAYEVKSRNEESIHSIAEGLVLSGIAMTFAGFSRPASGLEHYFSHSWEMMALARGYESDLHGIQVGIGTLITIKIYEHLKTIQPTMSRAVAAADAFSESAWENNIRRVFGDTADGIIEMEQRVHKNDRAGRLARAERIIDRWDEILAVIEAELPKYEDILDIMSTAGMPLKPQDIGVPAEDVIDAFICSRDIRDKYLISSLIWDLGYMDDFAQWLREQIC